MKSILLSYFSDIRFLILLFFILRFFGITNPPLETAHNWRQTDMMMVARNMAEEPVDFLYPRVDYNGAEPGIVGMEFPLVNMLIATAINVFGFSHWYGRLINLIISSFGIFFFYLILKRLFNQQYAFTSAFVLLASMWFAYSRKIMPDTISVSFLFAGIYCVYQFLDRVKFNYLFLLLSFFLIALGGLVKISGVIVLVLLAPVLFSKNYSFKNKLLVSIAVAFSMIAVFYWYFIWVPHLNTLSPIRFFMGNSLMVGLHEIMHDFSRVLMRFYETALGYLGFVFVLIGGFFAIKTRHKILMLIVGFGVLLQMGFLLKVGVHFSIHSYYIIPFVPIMAMLAAFGINKLPKKYFALLLVLLFIENGARYYNEFIVKAKVKPVEHLDQLLDELNVAKNDLVAVNGNGSPTLLYFTGRKGWQPSDDNLLDENYLKKLKEKGCHYVVVCKTLGTNLELPLNQLIHEDNTFRVYKL